MPKETRQISVVAYRDSKGNPCCAGDFSTGDVCLAYRTQRFGVNETCVFADPAGRYAKTLERRDGGNGSLVPCAECPVWSNAMARPFFMKTHDTKTLPKWAQEHIEELETRVKHAEQTIPWTKPGMEWFTILHPDTRAADDKGKHRKLFFLGEDYAQAVCSVGPTDCVFIGRSRPNTQGSETP